jgi:NAD(P)-dependent dehydrogenase (short-subunit alcohol dehydrogenase family)
MSFTTRTLVVFGSGPGIGRSVAVNFASHGFTHIILLSRNQQRLEQDKAAVVKAAGAQDIKVDTLIIDLSSQASIQKALAEIDGLAKSVEVVFYNGARVAPTPLFNTPVEDIENDFKVRACARLLNQKLITS